jgi:hypothetical protein
MYVIIPHISSICTHIRIHFKIQMLAEIQNLCVVAPTRHVASHMYANVQPADRYIHNQAAQYAYAHITCTYVHLSAYAHTSCAYVYAHTHMYGHTHTATCKINGNREEDVKRLGSSKTCWKRALEIRDSRLFCKSQCVLLICDVHIITLHKLTRDFSVSLHKLTRDFSVTVHKLTCDFLITLHKLTRDFSVTVHKLTRDFLITLNKLTRDFSITCIGS